MLGGIGVFIVAFAIIWSSIIGKPMTIILCIIGYYLFLKCISDLDEKDKNEEMRYELEKYRSLPERYDQTWYETDWSRK